MSACVYWVKRHTNKAGERRRQVDITTTRSSAPTTHGRRERRVSPRTRGSRTPSRANRSSTLPRQNCSSRSLCTPTPTTSHFYSYSCNTASGPYQDKLYSLVRGRHHSGKETKETKETRGAVWHKTGITHTRHKSTQHKSVIPTLPPLLKSRRPRRPT